MKKRLRKKLHLGEFTDRLFTMTAKVTGVTEGETVDVAGLLTGSDLLAALRGEDLGERLLISATMLRHGGDVFLDDVSLAELSDALGVPVVPVRPDGAELLDAVVGR